MKFNVWIEILGNQFIRKGVKNNKMVINGNKW